MCAKYFDQTKVNEAKKVQHVKLKYALLNFEAFINALKNYLDFFLNKKKIF